MNSSKFPSWLSASGHKAEIGSFLSKRKPTEIPSNTMPPLTKADLKWLCKQSEHVLYNLNFLTANKWWHSFLSIVFNLLTSTFVVFFCSCSSSSFLSSSDLFVQCQSGLFVLLLKSGILHTYCPRIVDQAWQLCCLYEINVSVP